MDLMERYMIKKYRGVDPQRALSDNQASTMDKVNKVVNKYALPAVQTAADSLIAYTRHHAEKHYTELMKKKALFDARVAMYEAEDRAKKLGTAASRAEADGLREVATQMAKTAAEGVALNSGSPADVFDVTRYGSALTAINLRYMAVRELMAEKMNASNVQAANETASANVDNSGAQAVGRGASMVANLINSWYKPRQEATDNTDDVEMPPPIQGGLPGGGKVTSIDPGLPATLPGAAPTLAKTAANVLPKSVPDALGKPLPSTTQIAAAKPVSEIPMPKGGGLATPMSNFPAPALSMPIEWRIQNWQPGDGVIVRKIPKARA